MSDLRACEPTSWIGSLAASRMPTFTPWNSEPAPREGANDQAAPVNDPAAIHAEGFAQGFEQGRRTVELELAAERDALARLAESMEVLRPQPSSALATLLAETVERLVRQIVGEVGIDPALLVNRAENAAALVGEELEPSKLLVHPDDVALLSSARIPLNVVGDPTLERGSIVLECGGGWIEDGPQVRLERLRAALGRIGAPE